MSAFLVAAALTLVGQAAMAQNYPRVAPRLPEGAETAPVSPPRPSEAERDRRPQDADPVLLSVLKGVVFVDGPFKLKREGLAPDAAGASGVDTGGLADLETPEFRALVAPYVGRPFRLSDLDELREAARSWYIERGKPFLDVTAPPQNVTSGVVQIVVTQYRLGEVSVAGNKHFSEKVVRRPLTLKSGEYLYLPRIEEDLDRLNENPFLSVNAVFQPGKVTGETDLILQASDQRPVRVYAGYDNRGYRQLGLDQMELGVNWGNAFGAGHILSYQHTRSFTGRFTAHSASGVFGVGPKDKLLIFGSYSTVRPRIADGFNNVGHSGQASARASRALPPIGRASGNVQGGYDFKFTDNNLEFAGVEIFDSKLEVHQFPITVLLNIPDSFGQTSIANDLVMSPGDLSDRNTDAAFDALVPGAKARYVYDRLSVTRTTRLPRNMTWVVRASGQVASGNLPNSEQIGGGGSGSARGYYPDTAVGSSGVIVNTELRFPPFSHSALIAPKSRVGDALQAGLFYDFVDIRQVKEVEGGSPPARLESVGFLLNYEAAKRLDLAIDGGVQLRKGPNEVKKGGYVAVSVTLSF
ncbi:ShlB/FhaC/HecB family hemolysin secretion/activation protein [Phenylobacterium parvum]|nr:ShlB/FhaC/HecB family hemolysin secretion/activation protein [Phenylobacterium parvum]